MKTDWTTAPLGPADRALLAFAVKLTVTPAAMTRDDVAALRALGFDDRAVSDAVQIAGYFNYINRVADGLGVDLEEGMAPRPRLDRARPGQPAVE